MFKKIIAIILTAFLTAVVYFVTAGLFFNEGITPKQNNQLAAGLADSNSITSNAAATGQANQSQGAPVATTKVLTAAEIAKHNQVSDCWLIINSKVYNVTNYFPEHPGGTSIIKPYCGQEATQAFVTKNKGKPHSQYANDLLAAYYIGDVGQIVNSTLNQSQKKPTAADTSSMPLPSLKPNSGSTPSSTNPSLVTVTPVSNLILTLAEIAKHNTQVDCWLLISNKVYSVASYLAVHPGGRNAIIPYCGKEATAVFEGLPHSQNAHILLANYYVGDLGQTVVQPSLPSPAPNTIPASPSINPSNNREREDDDD